MRRLGAIMTNATKTRVSNEQLLAAIMAQTQAIQGLVVALTPKGTVQEPVVQPSRPVPQVPVKFAQSVPHQAEGRTISMLPEATEIPRGIKIEWLAGLVRKAQAWAASPSNTTGDKVAVYFVRSADGNHKPLFGRMGSKVSANAVSIYQLVN